MHGPQPSKPISAVLVTKGHEKPVRVRRCGIRVYGFPACRAARLWNISSDGRTAPHKRVSHAREAARQEKNYPGVIWNIGDDDGESLAADIAASIARYRRTPQRQRRSVVSSSFLLCLTSQEATESFRSLGTTQRRHFEEYAEVRTFTSTPSSRPANCRYSPRNIADYSGAQAVLVGAESF